ncbi:YhcH/YjgK/YiaL family protein [Oscillospiraceae bacterium LTW-04]|nr:YhcH/YjgK/YiaL family protein [Oscillospiraceae bacterium MB24-C1]
MVYDYLINAEKYKGLGAGITAGFAALHSHDLESLEPGDYPIFADDIILKIQSYNTKPVEQARLEAHRRYIDIQYIVSGEEKIAVGALEQAGEELEANPENDIWFYAGNADTLTLKAGQFVLLFPGETHAPCLAATESAPVKKALIKVALNYEP